MKLGTVLGSVLFLIAGITLAGNSREVMGLSDLELTNIAASATSNATATALEEANKLLGTAKNASANATQTGIEQAKSVMVNVANNVSNATSNTTGTAINEANKLIGAAAPNATENTTGETQTYENRDIGIKFQYPSDWGKIEVVSQSCDKDVCTLGAEGTGVRLGLFAASKEACDCNLLMDFVRKMYKSNAQAMKAFSFIGDNQTTVGKKYPGWQYEYSFLDNDNANRTSLNVLTTNNQTYLTVVFGYLKDSQAKLLPQFKNVIDSIEFSPVQVAKKPSFMTLNETEQLKGNSNTDGSPGLQILSHNSFTDSIGTMHVVGEVQNNSPTTATYVEVTGTFYDSNNQVVGTQFTYTNPSDIAGGDKAPFDLTLLSASIPTSQIDHYNLQASSQ